MSWCGVHLRLTLKQGIYGEPHDHRHRPQQRADHLIESLTAEAPGFLSIGALIEMVWVLSCAFGLNRAEVSQVLEQLLQTKEIILDRADQVLKATRQYKSSSADFADCLIERLGTSAGCARTVTFDVGASGTAGMQLP